MVSIHIIGRKKTVSPTHLEQIIWSFRSEKECCWWTMQVNYKSQHRDRTQMDVWKRTISHKATSSLPPLFPTPSHKKRRKGLKSTEQNYNASSGNYMPHPRIFLCSLTCFYMLWWILTDIDHCTPLLTYREVQKVKWGRMSGSHFPSLSCYFAATLNYILRDEIYSHIPRK